MGLPYAWVWVFSRTAAGDGNAVRFGPFGSWSERFSFNSDFEFLCEAAYGRHDVAGEAGGWVAGGSAQPSGPRFCFNSFEREGGVATPL